MFFLNFIFFKRDYLFVFQLPTGFLKVFLSNYVFRMGKTRIYNVRFVAIFAFLQIHTSRIILKIPPF